MPHHEIELKWALTVATWEDLGRQLQQDLGQPLVRTQVNRFYDTPDRRLRSALLNLRLRQEGEAVLMTCKQRSGSAGEASGGLARHVEWEEWLPAATVRLLDGPPDTWLALLPLPPIVRSALDGAVPECLGGFANHRQEFTVQRDGTAELLCLDRTTFDGRIDHELEIETDDPPTTARFWQGRLAEWGIPWQPQGISKFARYLQISGVR